MSKLSDEQISEMALHMQPNLITLENIGVKDEKEQEEILYLAMLLILSERENAIGDSDNSAI
jgi:hypothetical protein